MTFVLCGLDIDDKAALVRRQLDRRGRRARACTWTLARTDHADADTEEAASALLHVTIKTPDPKRAKAFSRAAVELALASYPGFTLTSPPGDGTPVGVYRPEYVPQQSIEHVAVLPDGTRAADRARRHATGTPTRDVRRRGPRAHVAGGPTRRVPLGHHRRRPLRRQGRRRQPRRLGPRPGRLPVARERADRRPAPRAAAGGQGPRHRAAPAAEPARGQLRAARPARPGRGRVHPLRPAGQVARRVAALAARRRPGGAAVTADPFRTPERAALRETVRRFVETRSCPTSTSGSATASCRASCTARPASSACSASPSPRRPAAGAATSSTR